MNMHIIPVGLDDEDTQYRGSVLEKNTEFELGEWLLLPVGKSS